MPHHALVHATATRPATTVATSIDSDNSRIKKERRNERDRQRSLLKRESLQDMRTLVDELEATKRKLLACQQQQHAPTMTLAAATHARDDFVRVTERIERLRFENAALAASLRSRDLFNSAMQHLLLDFDRESPAAPLQFDLPDPKLGPDTKIRPNTIGFAPLTPDEVDAFVTRALRHVCTARLEHEASRAAAAGSVFGWSDFRVRSGATITFAVRKPLPHTNAKSLRDSMWDLATDSRQIARLLPAGLKCTLEVLQTVSTDALVVDRRTILGTGVTLRTVFLVFRTRDPDCDTAELLVMKTLDSPLAKKLLLPNELWCDIFYWMRFEPIVGDSDTTTAEFGGVLTYKREDLAVSWLAELLFLAVRWETIAVRPVLLTASTCA